VGKRKRPMSTPGKLCARVIRNIQSLTPIEIISKITFGESESENLSQKQLDKTNSLNEIGSWVT